MCKVVLNSSQYREIETTERDWSHTLAGVYALHVNVFYYYFLFKFKRAKLNHFMYILLDYLIKNFKINDDTSSIVVFK
jgi:hypothetical protein